MRAWPSRWWWPGCAAAWGLALPGWCAVLPATADPAPAHVQRFRYDGETSYALVALPGVPTDLQLGPDEHVTGFALGDTLQWLTEELPGHVFVKPLKAGLFTAGTLVTDRRTYQLTLRSVSGGQDWMQRVAWSYPDLVVLRAPLTALPAAGTVLPGSGTPGSAGGGVPGAGRAVPADGTGPWPGPTGMDPSRLNYDYRLTGTASFRPLLVVDDGRSTWLRMPPRTSLPALYLRGEGGETLVNYAVQGDWLVLARVASHLLLRLGHDEVQILRHADARGHP